MAELIYLWQRIVTPHMTGLAVALDRSGLAVTYVAEGEMSRDRADQGWAPPALPGVKSMLAPTKAEIYRLAAAAPSDAIHIGQGLRGNGLVGLAQDALARKGARQWIVMETVDDAGWRGVLKRWEYRRLFAMRGRSIEGVLAIGSKTADWVAARGVPPERVYPFSYFLSQSASPADSAFHRTKSFRVLFVGQHISRKRLDLLIAAVAALPAGEVELAVVGSGPLEAELKAMAETLLPQRIHWVGRLPIDEVPREMARADCLVLPSRHDGWGAVISEALMVGTPVICSDRCGASGVVLASRRGGVFPSDDIGALTSLLQRMVDAGRQPPEQRTALAKWARCLSAEAGASYLTEILQFAERGGTRPVAPWDRATKQDPSTAFNAEAL